WHQLGCAELDLNGNLVTRAMGEMLFGSLDPRYAGGIAAAGNGTQPDTRLTRLAPGIWGASGLQTSALTVAPFGTTPTGLAQSSGGTTTRNYKLVGIDGAGNPALASLTFSTTTSPATLSASAKVGI